MAEKPHEEGYISVVDEEPEIFDFLKWDSANTQKPQEPLRPVEKAKSPDKRVSKPQDTDPFDMNDTTFIETYRLTKDLARNLCEELKPVMPETIKSIEFSVESKVLTALSFYATGKYQKSIGRRTDPNATSYFVSSAVLQVTEAMNDPRIVTKYIHFPHLRDERDIIKARFYIKYMIPNVIGCIDCMHVPIARPDEDQKIHFNKSYHSKKVQIICDSDMNITSVDARGGGSLAHDALLRRHAVRVDMESLHHSGEQSWLIGNAHYSQASYLMTPLPKITRKTPVCPERYYTFMHAKALSCVTETIKHLKSRWKCLQATCNKQFDPVTVSRVVVACCVLHNICNRNGIPVVPMTQTEERLEAMKQKVANSPIPKKQTVDENGVQVRNMLVERVWNERRIDADAQKKRPAKKVKVVQAPPPPMPPQMLPQQHQQPMQHQHQMLPPHLQHIHHEDLSKRPRIISVTTPTYSLNVPPSWGHHYPQH